MDNIGDLCHVTFPWIAGQAIRLGIETKDNSFAQLGYHLVLLSQSFPLSSLVESPQLVQIVHLVNKACSVSRNGNDGPSRPYHILLRVSEIQKSRLAADRALANDVQQGLAQFVSLKNPEYPSLLRLITEFLGKQDLPSESSKEQIVTWGANDRPHAQVNNALYNQLRIYSTCSCNTRHLEDARLRLDSDQTSWNHALVQFNLLFAASPSHCPESHPQPRWKEGRVLVARDDRSHQKKRVVFSDVDTELPLTTLASSPPPSSTRKIGLGELCKLIQSEGSSSVHLEIRDNAMKLNENIEYTSHRHFPPQASVPLAKWLEQTSHISNRVKVTLAYIIAKSVWQYYDSNWMRKPWTNESIQIIKETIQDRKQSQPHPYFTTTLSKPQGQMLDYYTADNICHMFPTYSHWE
ncbi:hypothetical protein N7470_006568 [Penicillium chermesinum]|nr:hypothetical protein N7470_006568 [Penicillium chermesinum]